MTIDLFNHFFPPRYAHEVIEAGLAGKDMGKRVRNVPTIADLDARFRVMDEFGEYCQFLTLPAPPMESMAPPDKSPEFARMANDGLAELTAKYPDRFIGFAASLPMNNVDECLREIDRSVTQLGARGFQIYTNVAGKPLDLPEFAPIFEEAARRDLTIWMHPARGADFPDYKTETKSKYEIWWTFGWPYETSAAMARLVFSGMFDRHPKLRIVTHHMGGMIPYFEGRVGYGWDVLGSRTSDEDYVASAASMPIRRCLADRLPPKTVSISLARITASLRPTCLSNPSPACTFARPSAASKAWISAPPIERRFTRATPGVF